MKFYVLLLSFALSLLLQSLPAWGQSCGTNFQVELQKTELLELKAHMAIQPTASPQMALLRRSFELKLQELKLILAEAEFSDFLLQLKKAANSKSTGNNQIELKNSKENERATFLGPKNVATLPKTEQESTPEKTLLNLTNIERSQAQFISERNFTLLTKTEKILLFKKTTHFIFIDKLQSAFKLEKGITPHLLSITDNGKNLAYFDSSKNTLHLWETSQLKNQEVLLANSKRIKIPPLYNPNYEVVYSKIILSEDSKFVVISDNWKYHQVVNLLTLEIETFTNNEGKNPQFRFSPDSKKLAAVRDNYFVLLDLTKGPQEVFKDQYYFGDLALRSFEWNAQSTDLLAVLSNYGSQVFVYTLGKNKFFEPLPKEPLNGNIINSIKTAWSSDGQYLALAIQKSQQDIHALILNPISQESIMFHSPYGTLTNIQWNTKELILITTQNPSDKVLRWINPVEVHY